MSVWAISRELMALMPRYIDDVTSLISGPKRFVLSRTSSDEPHLTDALLFLAISFMIGWPLKISFLKQDALLDLSVSASFVALYVVTFGGAVCLAWRCVGGVGDIKKHFIIHFYYAGGIGFIMACGFMAMVGVFRAVDPQLYEEFFQAVYQGQAAGFMIQNHERIFNSNGGIALVSINYLFNIILLAWIIAGWGAYRKLNQLSKLRSGLAFTLFMLFSVPITVVLYLIANADVR